MALFYKFSTTPAAAPTVVELYSGDSDGFGRLTQIASDVFWMQATGDELDLIRQNFTNIPMFLGRVVEWESEIARFIARHLEKAHYRKYYIKQ